MNSSGGSVQVRSSRVRNTMASSSIDRMRDEEMATRWVRESTGLCRKTPPNGAWRDDPLGVVELTAERGNASDRRGGRGAGEEQVPSLGAESAMNFQPRMSADTRTGNRCRPCRTHRVPSETWPPPPTTVDAGVWVIRRVRCSTAVMAGSVPPVGELEQRLGDGGEQEVVTSRRLAARGRSCSGAVATTWKWW
jgi:hypothetical protein